MKLAGVALAVVLLYVYLNRSNSVLGSSVTKQIPGKPTTGRPGVSGQPVYTNATAQDISASSGLVSAFTGMFKAFNPGVTTPASQSSPVAKAQSYGTVAAPDPFQLAPTSFGSAPSVFSGNQPMPNLQTTNDAGVASGTDNTFAAAGMPQVFDGLGGSGYGIGAGTYEGNTFGTSPDSTDPNAGSIPLSGADTYQSDLSLV